MVMKVTTRKVLRTWHATCVWATGMAPTEAGAVKQLAKCLSSSSHRMIVLKYGTPPLAPGHSVEYVTSMKLDGITVLQYNICSYTGGRPPMSIEKALRLASQSSSGVKQFKDRVTATKVEKS